MKLLFVHGWSVTSKRTYGGMPAALAAQAPAHGLQLDLKEVFLGRYISFRDEVRMDDLERAFDRAVRDALGVGPAAAIPRFSCITHSTGGPLVRCWVDRYYGATSLAKCPLEHLIMLAPPNHGSALAQLGKATLGRMKAWAEGIEPGQQILDWLELGSDGQRALNLDFLHYDLPALHAAGVRHFPVVLTGETIDRSLFDYINSYTGEPGSDGVVRAASANLDARWLTLVQTDTPIAALRFKGTTALETRETTVRQPAPTVFRLIPDASHSGDKIGIIKSVKAANAAKKEVVARTLEALKIRSGADYNAAIAAARAANTTLQAVGQRYFQIVFSVRDDEGRPVHDFDIILLGGPDYDPDALPKGFFRDRQKNRANRNAVTYYMNHDVMMGTTDRKFGFRVIARPDNGFARYTPAEFHSDTMTLDAVIDPNVTTYVDIVLKRRVDAESARFDPESDGYTEFKNTRPSGREV
jgi:hypothetical protein